MCIGWVVCVCCVYACVLCGCACCVCGVHVLCVYVLCVYVPQCLLDLEVRRQCVRVGFLLPSFGFWGLNLGHQTWKQAH